jgi:hypothetical protein
MNGPEFFFVQRAGSPDRERGRQASASITLGETLRELRRAAQA